MLYPYLNPMPTLIPEPTRITAAGNKPKLIDEYIGRVNSKTSAASVAHMRSPQGWIEPGQTPEFEEFTIVLKGLLRVEHKQGALEVKAGQAVITHFARYTDQRIVRVRTTIDIGERLLQKAMRLSGCLTKRATVEAGLRLLVETKAQADIRLLKGRVQWEGNLDESRRGRT